MQTTYHCLYTPNTAVQCYYSCAIYNIFFFFLRLFRQNVYVHHRMRDFEIIRYHYRTCVNEMIIFFNAPTMYHFEFASFVN